MIMRLDFDKIWILKKRKCVVAECIIYLPCYASYYLTVYKQVSIIYLVQNLMDYQAFHFSR